MMKWIEVYFWALVYWAIYLCLAGIATLVTGRGGLLELLVIGLLMTVMVVICLRHMEGVLFFDFDTPGVVLVQQTVPPTPLPAIKRGRKPKKPVEKQPEEVLYDEKEAFVEPEPAMRTDVDIAQLDADGILS